MTVLLVEQDAELNQLCQAVEQLREVKAKVMRTSVLHRIQAKERRRSSMGVQFIFFRVEA